MKVKVNKDTCIGCGACQAICPDVFEYDDEGLMDANQDNVSNDNKEDIIDAADGCPVAAIEVSE